MENENKTLKYNANQKEALKMVSLAEEYEKGAKMYAFLLIISAAIYFLYFQNIYIIGFIAVSLISAVGMFLLFQRLKDQGRIDNCYISLEQYVDGHYTYINCNQFFDGNTEEMRIKISEIERVLGVKDGIQIWLKEEHEGSMVLVNGQTEDRRILQISTFGYSVENFKDVALNLCVEAENADIIIDEEQWTEYNDNKNTIVMVIPMIAYALICITSLLF